MIYALMILNKKNGANLMDIQFKDVYSGYADLFSSFINAMEGMIMEVFKRSAIENLDLGDMRVEFLHNSLWNIVVLCDKNIDKNAAAIEKVDRIIKGHRDVLEGYINRSMVVQDNENFRAEIIDVISDMAVDSLDESIISGANEKLTRMIQLRHRTNLTTQLRIISTKIKISAMVNEDTEKYEVLFNEVSALMEERKKEAQYWLELLKNATYEEYIASQGVVERVNWAAIFFYFVKFSELLGQITKNEVVNKYMEVVKNILNSMSGEPYKGLLDLIRNMSDCIDSYLNF